MEYDCSSRLSSSLPVKTKTSSSSNALRGLPDWLLIKQVMHHLALRIDSKQRNFGLSAPEGARILVVDDSKEVRELLDTVFNECGFTVVIADNGLEAVRKFNEGAFDIILTDICMPGMNGNILSKQIKKIDRNIPVIAITASPGLAENHFDEVLAKPFDLECLLQAVELVLFRSIKYQSMTKLAQLKEKISNQKKRQTS